MWGENGEPPECSIFYNYACLVMPHRDVAVVSLKSTAIKAAKSWNSHIRLKNRDTFAGLYELHVVEQKNQFGSWSTFMVKPKSWVDEDTYVMAEGIYNALRQERIEMDIRGLGQETEENPDAEGVKTPY